MHTSVTRYNENPSKKSKLESFKDLLNLKDNSGSILPTENSKRSSCSNLRVSFLMPENEEEIQSRKLLLPNRSYRHLFTLSARTPSFVASSRVDSMATSECEKAINKEFETFEGRPIQYTNNYLTGEYDLKKDEEDFNFYKYDITEAVLGCIMLIDTRDQDDFFSTRELNSIMSKISICPD